MQGIMAGAGAGAMKVGGGGAIGASCAITWGGGVGLIITNGGGGTMGTGAGAGVGAGVGGGNIGAFHGSHSGGCHSHNGGGAAGHIMSAANKSPNRHWFKWEGINIVNVYEPWTRDIMSAANQSCNRYWFKWDRIFWCKTLMCMSLDIQALLSNGGWDDTPFRSRTRSIDFNLCVCVQDVPWCIWLVGPNPWRCSFCAWERETWEYMQQTYNMELELDHVCSSSWGPARIGDREVEVIRRNYSR